MSDDQNEMEIEGESENESEEESQNEDDATQMQTDKDQPKEAYLPGKALEEGEELVCDQSAYVMLHQAQTGAPCLSFDILRDHLGDNRDSYPLSAFIVAGTQAARTHVNNVMVIKMSNLNKTGENEDDDDDESDDDDDDESKRPQMTSAFIKHQGSVNRIRVGVFKS